MRIKTNQVNYFQRLKPALIYALSGLKLCWQNEAAFRQEVFFMIIILPLIIFSPLPLLEKLIVIASLLLVLICELFNSAIECVVDLHSYEHTPLGKIAKDTASASVFLAITICLIFILFLLVPSYYWLF